MKRKCWYSSELLADSLLMQICHDKHYVYSKLMNSSYIYYCQQNNHNYLSIIYLCTIYFFNIIYQKSIMFYYKKRTVLIIFSEEHDSLLMKIIAKGCNINMGRELSFMSTIRIHSNIRIRLINFNARSNSTRRLFTSWVNLYKCSFIQRG